MLSRFFIDRPIFASVPSIIIVLVGLAAVFTLPIAQYPEITPPTVQVSCVYPGASAQVVAETVGVPIEQQVNGVENMLYMSSNSSNDGAYTLTITFKLGTDLDFAQVLVQNRVSAALPSLPETVRQTGVTTRKRSPDILLVVNLFSPRGSETPRDQLYLSNYATLQIRDQLARIDGVGDVVIFGQQDYSMRIWLDPERMAGLDLTAGDVIAAIREQNVQVAAGQVGQPPAPPGLDFQYTLTTLGRLQTPEQFGAIVVKSAPDGKLTYLRDVARIELGAKTRDQTNTLDGQPAAGVAIFQLPGSNALETAELVKAKMAELATRFPPGVEYAMVYDTTPFVRESVREVFVALRDAVILVALVVLAFLQSWRASLIPLVAVPVAIVGTFAAMALLGFSLNNLTLLGLVLAIGIVVDDAIVVVEAIEHHMEQGLAPREAAYQAMSEVSGPIIAISLVLSSVFIPSAFITGITGQFFRQFALTIAISTVLSAINSLTLSPALGAILLRPRRAKRDPLTWLLDMLLGWFFRGFNWTFRKATEAYLWNVRRLLRFSVLVLVIYAGLMYLTWYSVNAVPQGFIPAQDKGYLIAAIQLPDAASLERTQAVLRQADRIIQAEPGVAHTVGIAGQSFVFGIAGSNFASMFIILDPFDERHGDMHADAIAARLRARLFAEIPEAMFFVFGAPPVSGLGTAGGFKLMLEDRGDRGLEVLQAQADHFVERGAQLPGIATMSSTFRANTPQLFIDLDRTKAKSLGVELDDVFTTLQVFMAGFYVNDFTQFGRSWQVNLQADTPFRVDADAVRELKVRNNRGEMVPLGTLATVEPIGGPLVVTRYNMYPAVPVNGATLPGVSSGEMIRMVEALADQQLAENMAYEWTEITLLEILAGNTAVFAFGGAVILVFLILAAQYESWALPLSVILVVPLCILSSVAGVAIAGFDINIFTQVGFVVLVGLACKNAILMVEFAELQREAGASRLDAIIAAARLRLRPIMMTSFAFILGVVPLVLAHGAGAEMRKTLGVAVFSGMLGVTAFGVLLTPVFYYVIRGLAERVRRRREPGAGPG